MVAKQAFELRIEVFIILDTVDVVTLSHPFDVQDHQGDRERVVRQHPAGDLLGLAEAADRIVSAMETTIANKPVTYDFERLMEGATTLKTSEFGDALIDNM